MTPVVVVGAAVLDGEGRVLAARRARPARLAGWWEFPGGKVEPGEDDLVAVVRECREELGVEVEVTGPLGEVPIPGDGWVLRVYLARLVAGVPAAAEHAELRWLAPDELAGVRWLPADLPLVAALRARLRG